MPVSALIGNESDAPVTWMRANSPVERTLRSLPASEAMPPRPVAVAPDDIIRAETGSSGPQGLPFGQGRPKESIGNPKSHRR